MFLRQYIQSCIIIKSVTQIKEIEICNIKAPFDENPPKFEGSALDPGLGTISLVHTILRKYYFCNAVANSYRFFANSIDNGALIFYDISVS